MELRERFEGSMLGLAIGDALGRPTEFMSSVAAIRERWGPAGVTSFEGYEPGTYTDDTQMSIAVARALVRAGDTNLDSFALDRLMRVMGREFVAWARSPKNNRSPGGTCMGGCANLAEGVPWFNAGIQTSKGCGAAMRAAPVGLFYHDRIPQMIHAAAAQGALTHAHPTGVASSVAAAAPVAWACQERGLEGMLAFTRECVERLAPSFLFKIGCGSCTIEKPGTREMLAALDRTEAALEKESDDVCSLLGGAWVGEEAVACALWCVLKAGGDFRQAVLRGANSSGDSDSIACIAGSIAGAMVGTRGLPEAWVRDIETPALLCGLAGSLEQARRCVPGAIILGRDLNPFDAK